MGGLIVIRVELSLTDWGLRLRGGDYLLVVDTSKSSTRNHACLYSPTVLLQESRENPTHFYDTSITTCNTTAHLRSHSRYVVRAVGNIATPNAAAAGVDSIDMKERRTQDVRLNA
jgi:hypothetical protein